MKQTHKTMKGFTLIELLMVVALIAILSTVILMQLDSGRERAEVNKYVAYATQMHRLVADSAAAGQFDAGKISLTANSSYCLGDPSYNCGSNITSLSATGNDDEDRVFKALTYLTELPEVTDDNGFSPYVRNVGIYMIYKPTASPNVIRVVMPVGVNDTAYMSKLCNKIGWGVSGSDCYRDVKLHSRL